MVTNEQLRAIHARKRGISAKDVRRFKDRGQTPLAREFSLYLATENPEAHPELFPSVSQFSGFHHKRMIRTKEDFLREEKHRKDLDVFRKEKGIPVGKHPQLTFNEDVFDREQKEEFAELERIRRTDPKRFREIQLKEGAFDDVLTIDEIEAELRSLRNGS